MFTGQYLFKDNEVLTPWMPRQGDNFLVIAEVAALNGTNVQLKLEAVTKNEEDPGAGSTLGTALTINAVTPSAKLFTDPKELVRYRLTCDKPSGATADDYVLFRVIGTQWWDTLDGDKVI